jgi:hypothetical protein
MARLGQLMIPIPLQLELPKVIPPHRVVRGMTEELLESVGI